MPKTRVILELGSGNDLHGSDYTKAALRAVQDALHHSSLSFVRALKIDKSSLNSPSLRTRQHSNEAIVLCPRTARLPRGASER